ncbi:hypothetical protein [Pseudomonas sp. o96-267]|uniref:hypothetical protein n=1 Tax=Pseudomonas sp. o96-267 TaxID=2479853 RepID=UPI000F7889FC|nr:hypothetical protein [Pseudomonas sp. o96-267]
MEVWEWENFENIFNSSRFKVINTGLLYGPVTEFTLRRDTKLKIWLSTESAGDSESPDSDFVPGTVRTNTDAIECEDISGCLARAVGVTPISHVSSNNYISGKSITKQESTVEYVEIIIPKVPVDYRVDWVLNMDDGNIMWPDRHELMFEGTTSFSWGDDFLGVRTEDSKRQFGRTCFCFSIDGVEVVVGRSGSKRDAPDKRGYLIYKGDISDDVRLKIMGCASYALGMHLVHVGSAGFSSAGYLAYAKSKSAYSLGGRVFELGRMPPTPLGFVYQGEINPEVATRVIRALYDNYDRLNLRMLFWQYWHAQCAPYHVAAVHFGAAIEFLQKKYMEVFGKQSLGVIMPKPNWRPIRDEILALLQSKDMQSQHLELISSQLAGLNRAPQKIVMERFLSSLGISLGDVELTAWQHRNDAAHGNDRTDSDPIELIRGNKVLRVMLDRMILKIVEAADHYVDYYSYNFPVRNLADPIPTS